MTVQAQGEAGMAQQTTRGARPLRRIMAKRPVVVGQINARATFRGLATAPTEADLGRTTQDRVCAFARLLRVSAREVPGSVREGGQRKGKALSHRRCFFLEGSFSSEHRTYFAPWHKPFSGDPSTGGGGTRSNEESL